MTVLVRAGVLCLAAVVVAGCGSTRVREDVPIPTPIGRGPAFMPSAAGLGPRPGAECTRGPLSGRIRAHLELFARRRVVVIPPNVGVRKGCRYALRTLTPTGILELDRAGLTVGDFFAVWRMPLSARRLLTFRGNVAAYVDGERWKGDVRAIPLADEREIVLEVGGYVRPHRLFLFPPR